jgi:toxin CptA
MLYLLVQALAWAALLGADLALWAVWLGGLSSLGHAAWVVPRQILLSSPAAFCAVRCNAQGWQLWNRQGGWQSVQLRPDSLALPLVVILRFRLAGEWWVRGLCIPRDGLAREVHRRLRVRLKFSRDRWAAAK